MSGPLCIIYLHLLSGVHLHLCVEAVDGFVVRDAPLPAPAAHAHVHEDLHQDEQEGQEAEDRERVRAAAVRRGTRSE